ncbi:MAG: hypothetical protein EA357_02190 [Micavibrio sp.]|nr:MAG: hypothetical protein EA357_02190 [Micavibrio sp.]
MEENIHPETTGMMAEVIMVQIVLLLASMWVYYDAVKHKIGRVQEKKSLVNIPAGAWAALTMFLVLIVLPVYLILRKKLIALAEEHPVEPQNKILSVGLLLAVWGILFFIY